MGSASGRPRRTMRQIRLPAGRLGLHTLFGAGHSYHACSSARIPLHRDCRHVSWRPKVSWGLTGTLNAVRVWRAGFCSAQCSPGSRQEPFPALQLARPGQCMQVRQVMWAAARLHTELRFTVSGLDLSWDTSKNLQIPEASYISLQIPAVTSF